MEGSTATTIEELMTEDEAYKKSLKYKFKKIFEKEEVNDKIEFQEPKLKSEAEIKNEIETEVIIDVQE